LGGFAELQSNSEGLRYCEVFLKNKSEASLSESDLSPVLIPSNLSGEFQHVQSPLYVVFPWDDPVLAGNGTKTPALVKVLEGARKNSRVYVFSPDVGAHMAYFLDTKYLQTVLEALL
jgi:hypothetical protein